MNKINIITFCIVLIILLSLGLTTLLRVVESDGLGMSSQSLINGDFSSTFDESFGEEIVAKDFLIGIANKVKSLGGLNGSDELEIVTTDGINVATKMTGEGVKATDWGNILIHDGKALELYNYNEEAHRLYPEAVNGLAEAFEIDTYLMLVPTQIEFQSPALYEGLSYVQLDSMEEIYGALNQNVTPIRVYDLLEQHKDEYIYFRTDHHWTSRGAYYGYVAMAEKLEYDPIPLQDMEVLVKSEYLGSLYNLTLSDVLLSNPDELFVYYPNTSTEYLVRDDHEDQPEKLINDYYLSQKGQEYAVFLGGDKALSIIRNEDEKGKILVIKDSYANALLPFLSAHFEEIHIVDPRMYDGNLKTYISDNEIDKLIVINYVLVNRYLGYAEIYEELID